MIRQIFGGILLFAGLAMIGYSLYFSYNIFTGIEPVPVIFEIEESKAIPVPTDQGLQAQIQKMITQQLREIIPARMISRMLNLIAWSIFSGILIFGGAQIAGLGIKLLK